CTARGLTGKNLATCQQLLSAVPSQLYNLNKGLSTIQFQSLSVAADNSKHLQGGNQDNGTFETNGSAVVWPQIIYGDGGQSGFNVSNSALRFNTFTGQANDANFQNGDPTKWVIISAPIISSPEVAFFYPPIIADPHPSNAGSIYQGSMSVWRTQDWGGNQAFLEANCPEFTTSASKPGCGDFVQIGPPGSTDLTGTAYGNDRLGACATARTGCVAAIARATSDTGTLWAATGTGRVFISKNANAATASSVTYTRLDSLDASSPGRFVSGIVIDPADSNHAWVSYGSYSSLTPATPGHIFSVTYNQGAGAATWTNIDGSGSTAFPDFPATAIAFDSVKGDLYAGNDWGVLVLANGSTSWIVAGTGLPAVEVAGLTIVPSARTLYAATHGRSAWQLTLP
ncbi:MAG TPA: exo-alpha-sialidase, partial [Acidobacteriota bacterium]|nr:exo-alpha-sialidase [Acidobacteriota bacterium]